MTNRTKVILGVDDSPEDRAFLNVALTAAGYSFVGAAGGLECLALIHRVPPRLILLDVQMPGLNGYETCRRLRAIAAAKDIPIAFLTACNHPEDVKMGIAAGGNDFILKPFDRGQLIRRVTHLIGQRIHLKCA